MLYTVHRNWCYAILQSDREFSIIDNVALLSVATVTASLVMLTIRKKLAEQASSSEGSKGEGRGKGIKRRMSFRSQLLTEGETNVTTMCTFGNMYKVCL